jgi:hypothetical protein
MNELVEESRSRMTQRGIGGAALGSMVEGGRLAPTGSATTQRGIGGAAIKSPGSFKGGKLEAPIGVSTTQRGIGSLVSIEGGTLDSLTGATTQRGIGGATGAATTRRGIAIGVSFEGDRFGAPTGATTVRANKSDRGRGFANELGTCACLLREHQPFLTATCRSLKTKSS